MKLESSFSSGCKEEKDGKRKSDTQRDLEEIRRRILGFDRQGMIFMRKI